MSSCVWIAFALSQLIGGPLDLLDAEPPPAARPGFVEVGTVRFHPGLREVEVDATLNLRGGFIEFLACGTGVKRHESLLSLDCDPIDLNAAILLLGIEPGVPPRSEDDLGPIEGPRVMLRLRYGVTLPDGRAAVRDVRAEDVVTNGPMERAMAYCGFVYTGSQFIEQEDIIILDHRLLQRPQLEVAVVADGQFLVLGIAHPIPDLPRHPEDQIPDGHRRPHGNVEMPRIELPVLGMQIGVQGVDRVDRQVRGRQVEQLHDRARPQLPDLCVMPPDGPPRQRVDRAAFTVLRKTTPRLLGVVPVEAEIEKTVSGARLGDQFQRGRLARSRVGVDQENLSRTHLSFDDSLLLLCRFHNETPVQGPTCKYNSPSS